jgi:hypothetical protein
MIIWCPQAFLSVLMSLMLKRGMSGTNLTWQMMTGGLTGSGRASRQRMRTDLQLNFSVNFINFVQDLWNHLVNKV